MNFLNRPWLPAEDEELTALFHEGLDDYAIGQRLNRTAQAVAIHRQKHLKLKRCGPSIQRELIELVERGLSDRVIAERLGRSLSAIEKCRAKLGLYRGKRRQNLATPGPERIRMTKSPWISVGDGVMARTVTSA